MNGVFLLCFFAMSPYLSVIFWRCKTILLVEHLRNNIVTLVSTTTFCSDFCLDDPTRHYCVITHFHSNDSDLHEVKRKSICIPESKNIIT
jgi:hypothetical protein